MGDRPAPATHPAGLACEDWLEPGDLLVLTDDRRHGQHALTLPFRDATVLELAPDELPDIAGEFDALVIDRSWFDLGWLAEAVRVAVTALRPDSSVIVVLGSPGRPVPAPPGPGPVPLRELHWRGLGTVSGHPCAVMRVADRRDQLPAAPTGPAIATADLLVTADLAVRLATGPSAAVGQIASGQARNVLARQLEDRRQSEHELLQRLAMATSELERERGRRGRPTDLVRDLLGRSRIGRRALHAVRRGRSLAGRLRRGPLRFDRSHSRHRGRGG